MAKVNPGEFVRQVRQETAKVTWPTRKEVIQTTVMVLIMTALLSVFFLGVDAYLSSMVRPGRGDNAGVFFMLLNGYSFGDIFAQHGVALVVTAIIAGVAGFIFAGRKGNGR